MSKVVDVACVGIDEALLLWGDLVRAEMIGRHREPIVKMGRRWPARTRAGEALNGREIIIYNSTNCQRRPRSQQYEPDSDPPIPSAELRS